MPFWQWTARNRLRLQISHGAAILSFLDVAITRKDGLAFVNKARQILRKS
jgi:hypothetical protein